MLKLLLLAIVVVAILGPSLFNAMFAVSIVVLPHFARLTRAAVLAELSKDYVTAARVAGARLPRGIACGLQGTKPEPAPMPIAP